MIKRNIFIIFMLFTFSVLIFPQSLTVTEPDPGETWYKGTTYDIKWTSSGCTDKNIKINIFKNSIAVSNFVEQLTGLDNGSKSWTIPNSYVTGNYVIRIKTSDDVCKGDSGVFKIADDPTPEATITVTSPAKDDKWEKGTEYKIEWDKDGTMGNSVKITLHRYYSTTGASSTVTSTIASSTTNDGYKSWTVLASISSGDYVIRVKTTDNQVSGDSEKFSIINPPPTIVQPSNPMFTSPPKKVYTTTKVPNRRKYTKVDFLRKPDLRVTISFDPGNTWVGNSTKVIFTVKNMGMKVSKTTQLKVWQGSKMVENWHVTNIQPFKEFTKTIIWIPSKYGVETWLAKVDEKNKMGDTKRANNIATEKILVKAPDLIVCVTWDKRIISGIQTTIINKVKNIGDAPSTNCKLRIHIGLRGNSYYNIPKLAPGETFVVNKKARWIVPGNKKFLAYVDYKEEIIESNEKNNRVDSSLWVVELVGGIINNSDTHTKCSDGTK